MNLPKSIKDDAKFKLWRLGHLSFKMHSGQKELYELFYNSPHKVQTWLISRRYGKSWALCILALEQCIKQPNSIVKFLSPTKLQVDTYLRPLMREILEDCPDDTKPEFNQKDYIYYFNNGSEIQLAGSNAGHAEKLRGGNSNIAFVDEAQDCSDLANIVKSILLPTTLIEQAEERGSLIKKTIMDNPILTSEQKEELFNELGGKDTDESRRELFVEVIRDPKTSVIPEFTEDLEQEIVKEWKKPPHYDMYEGMDLGYKDLTVCLLSYYDFRNNKVVIEDEVVIDFKQKNVTIETLVAEIQKKEEKHFFNYLTNEQKKPTKRVSDIEYIVLNEIQKVSKFEMKFEAAKKDNLDAMVNFLREKLKKKEIVINPRCQTLIRHLRNIKWKKGDKSIFGRSPDDGHYDAVAALIYLIRAIDYRKNPYPAHYGVEQQDLFGNYILGREAKTTPNMDVYRKIFNIRDRKGKL
jgi:hypothetical protein